MRRIPESEYVEAYGSKVVTAQLIELYHNPGEVETFNTWYTGQTGMVLEDGTLGVYAHDYERWLREERLDRQLSNSWD